MTDYEMQLMEPTELGEAPKAETEAIYAWSFDTSPEVIYPTQRLTSRRITSMGLAMALVLIGTAGVVVLRIGAHVWPTPTVAAPTPPAAILDGLYRYDYAFENDTVMGTPISGTKDGKPRPDPWPRVSWRAFRSICTPAGCTATSLTLDDKNHQIAYTPISSSQWRLVGGQWRHAAGVPNTSREQRDLCYLRNGEFVPGEQTIQDEPAMTPQPDGTLAGLLTTTVVSSECGSEGMVWQSHYTMTRVGDVPSGLPLPDPSTVSASAPAPAPLVVGPQLDGTYRLEYDNRHTTGVDTGHPDAHMNNTIPEDNSVSWEAFRSICTDGGCVATGVNLDDVNHQQAANMTRPAVFRFTEGHWTRDEETLVSCKDVNRNGRTFGDQAAQTVKRTTEVALQPDGTLGGVARTVIESDDCGSRGVVLTSPIMAVRTGPVSPNVVLADPRLFV